MPPVGLKFGWGEIPQCGMDALVLIDLLGTMPNLGVSIGIVLIVGKVDFFFLNSSDDALSIAVLPSRAPDGVVAFNFNVTDHIGWLVEVIGASSYGPDDKDWACPPEVWKGDHGFEVEKHHATNWEQALKYIATRVGRFVSRSRHRKAAILRESTAVCVGFVDGDLTKVWPAPTPLWPNKSLERTRDR